MPFSRNVEIGRIAMVNYGPDYGKLVVISDVVDGNRVSKRGIEHGRQHGAPRDMSGASHDHGCPLES